MKLRADLWTWVYDGPTEVQAGFSVRPLDYRKATFVPLADLGGLPLGLSAEYAADLRRRIDWYCKAK